MKPKSFLLCFMTMLAFPIISLSQSVFTIPEVYENYETIENDTVVLIAYYSDTVSDLLVESYVDFLTDQVMPPNSIMKIDGMKPPEEAWRGGLIRIDGSIHFEVRSDSYHPEDSLIASIHPYKISVLTQGEPEHDNAEFSNGASEFSTTQCDPCKFAILISGGVNDLNNHPRYWKNLAELYNFKVSQQGYCPENILVNYFKGERITNDIPAENVGKADSASIADSFEEIAKRIAECSKAGKKASFQKMIYNHGMGDGNINLLDRKALKPQWLRDWQQMIIDSCCSTIYDEFLQCYAGYGVDIMATLNARNKTKIYVNSAANNDVGISRINDIHPYLKGKMDVLAKGLTYEDAVAGGKLAYDQHLATFRDRSEKELNKIQKIIDSINREIDDLKDIREILEGLQDEEAKVRDQFNSLICQSNNVIITAMQKYCEYHKYVLPPGGQLILKFTGKKENSGNVSVYKVNPSTNRLERVMVWNWNVPGSLRYVLSNEKRVINGDPNIPTTFWIHNDYGECTIRGEVIGRRAFLESASNKTDCSGFSVGGSDGVADEFSEINLTNFRMDTIDALNISLGDLPGYIGSDFVSDFEFTFSINPEDSLWQNMELYFEIIDVMNPGLLRIEAEGAENGYHEIFIESQGIYIAHLGDLREMGYDGTGQMTLRVDDAQFGFDCWGLRLSDNNSFAPELMNEELEEIIKLAPNPFGSGTLIEYKVPQSADVDLVIYDLSGKIVSRLENSFHQKGVYQTYFDANMIPKGIYILRLSVDNKLIGATRISRVNQQPERN